MAMAFFTGHTLATVLVVAFMSELRADVDIMWLTVAAFNAALFLLEAIAWKGFDP